MWGVRRDGSAPEMRHAVDMLTTPVCELFGMTHPVVQISCSCFRRDPDLARNTLRGTAHRGRHDELAHGARIDRCRRERSANRIDRNDTVTLVADPARFPSVVEVGAVRAEVVDEVDCHRARAEQTRNEVVGADQQPSSTVTGAHLELRSRLRSAFFRSEAQDWT